MNIELTYILVITLTSAMLFIYDKYAASRNLKRIPEWILHFIEFIGGVFANILLMYIIRHKNRKIGYYIWTWLLLIGWIMSILKMSLNQI